MKSLIFLLLFLPSTAHAQNISSFGGNVCLGAVACQPDTSANYYDTDTGIGKAMAICDTHSHLPSAVYPEGRTPNEYDNGWDACYKVRQEWNKTEQARKWRDHEAQEKHDKEFVSEVAKSLTK